MHRNPLFGKRRARAVPIFFGGVCAGVFATTGTGCGADDRQGVAGGPSSPAHAVFAAAGATGRQLTANAATRSAAAGGPLGGIGAMGGMGDMDF